MHTPTLETLAAPAHYTADPSPAPTKARFWDKLARRYASEPIGDPLGYERTLERTRQWLRPEHHVLEIGCGTGSTALHLAPEVTSYLGTDVSGHMVGIAREKLALHPRAGLRFETVDADRPTALGQRFDVILAFNVLHLVGDLDATLAACSAALLRGGRLISKTACLSEMNPLIPYLAIPLARLVGKAPPVRTLSLADLTTAMERHGLVVETVERHAAKGRDVRPFIVARKPTSTLSMPLNKV